MGNIVWISQNQSLTSIPPLERCIDDINIMLAPALQVNEFEDIVRSVYSMVYLLAMNIGKLDNRFEHTKIIGVGSAFDGTKVKELNEIDFVIHVKVPSASKILIAGDDPCRAHISIDNSSKHEWKDMCADFGDLCNNLLVPSKVLSVLKGLVIKAIDEIKSNKNKKQISRKSGKLCLASNHVDGSGPNQVVNMQWISSISKTVTEISVDVVYALSVEKELLLNIRNYIRKDLWEYIWTEAEAVGLVTPSRGRNMHSMPCSINHSPCWIFQFSEIECQMVNNDVHEIHKKCYRVLKYICQTDYAVKNHTTLKSLSSNMIKNIVLEHDHICHGFKNTQECFIDMVKRLKSAANEDFLPKFILPKTNIWYFDQESMCPKPPHQVISYLFEFINRLMATKSEDYDFTEELQFIHKHLHYVFGQINK